MKNKNYFSSVIEDWKNPIAKFLKYDIQALNCFRCLSFRTFQSSTALKQFCLLFKPEQAGEILSPTQKQVVKHSGVSNKKKEQCFKVTTLDLVVGWIRYGLATNKTVKTVKGCCRKWMACKQIKGLILNLLVSPTHKGYKPYYA